MNKLQRIIERDVCEQIDEPASFVDDGYSGRGMMGRKCVAIGGSMVQCQRTLAQIITVLHEAIVQEVLSISDEIHRNNEESRLATEFYLDTLKLLSFKTDNWGHDIVMYWPEIEFTEN